MEAEIERRCQQMDTPILPTILRHMGLFNATVKIPQHMSDYTWILPQAQLQPNRDNQGLRRHETRGE
jgi:hypothetical protein